MMPDPSNRNPPPPDGGKTRGSAHAGSERAGDGRNLRPHSRRGAYLAPESAVHGGRSLATGRTARLCRSEAGRLSEQGNGVPRLWSCRRPARTIRLRAEWHPGGGGLIRIRSAVDPTDGRRICRISGRRVLNSADGGDVGTADRRPRASNPARGNGRYPRSGNASTASYGARGGDRLSSRTIAGIVPQAAAGAVPSMKAGAGSLAFRPRDTPGPGRAPILLAVGLGRRGGSCGRRAAVWRTTEARPTWQGLPPLRWREPFSACLLAGLGDRPLEAGGGYFRPTSAAIFASRVRRRAGPRSRKLPTSCLSRSDRRAERRQARRRGPRSPIACRALIGVPRMP